MLIKLKNIFMLSFLALSINIACNSDAAEIDNSIKINQLQFIGTHNSYRQQNAANAHRDMSANLLAAWDKSHEALEYTHLTIPEQLNLGIRQIEIDVVSDTFNSYTNPFYINQAFLNLGDPDYTASQKESLLKPGFKVLHLLSDDRLRVNSLDFDIRSSCFLFTDCLKNVMNWSQEHPNHLPITILIEVLNDNNVMTKASLADMETEILSVFPKKKIITPQNIRGKYPSLRTAVLAGNWPTITSARGQVMFILDNDDMPYSTGVRDLYFQLHPNLSKDALIFPTVDITNPAEQPWFNAAAFVKINDPMNNKNKIRELVSSGFMVRTRADADTVEARHGDFNRFNTAKVSGAQWISSDYVYLNYPEIHLNLESIVDCNNVNGTFLPFASMPIISNPIFPPIALNDLKSLGARGICTFTPIGPNPFGNAYHCIFSDNKFYRCNPQNTDSKCEIQE